MFSAYLRFLFLFLLSKLLHENIDSIEKKLSGAGGTLTIRCKDFSVIQLDIPSAEACINIASSVEQLSNIGKYLLNGFFLYVCKGHPVKKGILPEKLAIENTVHNCIFFKEINNDKSFHVPKDCQHDLLYWLLCLELFLTGESVCFHSMDCLFN